MKPTTLTLLCGFALTAMTTAGASHWWSVRQFVTAVGAGMSLPRAAQATSPPSPSKPPVAPAPEQLATREAMPPATAPASDQQKFYEALIAKMNGLQTQNHDLLDQLAETNRDLMKLEFRVDTHSESFRPMPVSDDRPLTRVDDTPGVLPPRAKPVAMPEFE